MLGVEGTAALVSRAENSIENSGTLVLENVSLASLRLGSPAHNVTPITAIGVIATGISGYG